MGLLFCMAESWGHREAERLRIACDFDCNGNPVRRPMVANLRFHTLSRILLV